MVNGVENPKVLIVDDQSRNLDALEALLAPLRCVLIRAQSADEALLCLLKHDFAAIVLDIRMPGMSGIELAKLIKQRKRSQDVPLLWSERPELLCPPGGTVGAGTSTAWRK